MVFLGNNVGENDTYYFGRTTNLRQRLKQRNAGQVKATKYQRSLIEINVHSKIAKLKSCNGR